MAARPKPWIKGKCARCDRKRTADGHDPCIANLPGVQYGCCGHGVKEGYVMFTDGRVLRGYFDHVDRLDTAVL
jgi:hypothetical protein